MYFDTIEDFSAAFTPYTGQIMGDIRNYATISPLIEIGEVKM